MGKKRRLKGASAPSPAPEPNPGKRRSVFLAGRRRLYLRAALLLFLPALVVGLEVVLRLGGYGYATTFFVKSPAAEGYLATNPHFGWRFMPRETATQPYGAMLAAKKPPGTIRVFVLGESAAQGTPAPPFGFARILEVMLNQQFPEKRFEIINAAMRGINSHAILPIAEECARYSPDLFLIYMGNNETVGLWSPAPGKFNLTPYRRLIRASQWAKSTKLAQLLDKAVRALRQAPGKRPEQDMEFFRQHRLAAEDPRRAAVYGNFQTNLKDICRVTRAAGAKAIVSTVAVNLKDFPPLGSLHRADLTPADLAQWEAAFAKGVEQEGRGLPAEALTHYTAALRLDDHFAELHFRLGRCYLAAGQAEPARRHFTQARDWDALQFRTDGRLNDIVREVISARHDPGLVLLDTERAFAAQSDQELPGQRWFQEHVHLTFDGDHLLAQTFLPAVIRALELGPPVTPSPPVARAAPTRQECAEALAFTEWDEISVASAVARMTAGPPFQDQAEHGARQAQLEQGLRARTQAFREQGGPRRAVEAYRAASARRPHDWQIHFNFGNLLGDFSDQAGAAREYEAAVKLMPAFLTLRVAQAQALWKSGQRYETMAVLNETLRLDPECASARLALAQISGRRPK
jgi:tetratricopeptide (TPR) repeat protein